MRKSRTILLAIVAALAIAVTGVVAKADKADASTCVFGPWSNPTTGTVYHPASVNYTNWPVNGINRAGCFKIRVVGGPANGNIYHFEFVTQDTVDTGIAPPRADSGTLQYQWKTPGTTVWTNVGAGDQNSANFDYNDYQGGSNIIVSSPNLHHVFNGPASSFCFRVKITSTYQNLLHQDIYRERFSPEQCNFPY